MRELADYDFDKAQRIIHWPIREALEAQVARIKKQAADEYKFEYTIWAALAPHSKKNSEPPKLPQILRERK